MNYLFVPTYSKALRTQAESLPKCKKKEYPCGYSLVITLQLDEPAVFALAVYGVISLVLIGIYIYSKVLDSLSGICFLICGSALCSDLISIYLLACILNYNSILGCSSLFSCLL